MISLPSGTRIWLVAGVTDMRKSFNGLGECNERIQRLTVTRDLPVIRNIFLKLHPLLCSAITAHAIFY